MILHVMILDKFLPPFIDFVDTHFGRGEHKYVFITSEKYQFGLTPEHNVEFLHTDNDIFITLLSYMKESRKIILHGLWRDKIDLLLVQNPALFKKCYWAMWGGDFYHPDKQSNIRKKVIKSVGYLITQIQGDFELVRSVYGSSGELILLNCGYPSNIYRELAIKPKDHSIINIQIGNSATDTNNHMDIFEQLKKYKDMEIKIFVPLSYGNKEYANNIIEKGKELYGEQFVPLTEFMSFEKYIEFLGTIDIAIFAHKRQQAMGNITTLLGLGKKVYMRSDISSWSFLKSLDVEVFDANNINISILDKRTSKKNKSIIKHHFSKENLIKDCKKYLI